MMERKNLQDTDAISSVLYRT
jgi:hypothetical protein